MALSLVSGIALGSLYGLLALGFYVTYAVSGTVNFAQGSSMMLGAVLCYSFAVTLGWAPAISIALALLLCAVWGLLVERVAVRPFAARGSNGWLMATVALGIILENATLFLFGKEPRNYPSVLADMPVEIAGVPVLPLQLAIPAAGLVIALGLHLVARHTRLGKALLAVMQNADAARLMGIDVSRAVAGCYAVSTVFAGIAGILIAPLFNVSSDMGTLFGIKAFAVAIIGGITSPWGVVLAGFGYGILEAIITALAGSAYTQVLTFAAVIVALTLTPNGLLGRAGTKKV
jgi:branched-chain amino acid transport system permease protein